MQRVLGKKWGITNAILDMLKVPVAMLWAFSVSLWSDATSQQHYFNYISYYWPALVALIGHIYPIFHKFKGGRGVSSFWGMAIMFNPWWGLIFSISWISVCFLLKKAAYASIISTSFTSIMAWVPQTSSIENQQLKVAYSENYQFLFHQKIIWFNQLQQIHGAQQGDLLITIQLAITLAAILVVMRHRVYLSKKNKTL